MDVLVLGATGRVASTALTLLARRSEVGRVVMGGRSIERLISRREELGVVADVISVDALDPVQIEAAARSCDVVLNLAGLDDTSPLAAARGALHAGCHYVDIAASATAVRTMLSWSAEFRRIGRTAIPSIGILPGAANLLACHAAAQLDRCDSVAVNWGVPFAFFGDPKEVATSYAAGAPVMQSHAALVAQASRVAPVLVDGVVEWVRPADAPADVVALDGRAFVAFPIGSPEALTLPLALPDVRNVAARSVLWPHDVTLLAQTLGEGDDLDAATRSLFREASTWPAERLTPPTGFDRPAVWAQAEGLLDGRPHTVRCSRAVLFSTAAAAVAAVCALDRYTPLAHGVIPAECLFPPLEFFRWAAALEGHDAEGRLINVQVEASTA